MRKKCFNKCFLVTLNNLQVSKNEYSKSVGFAFLQGYTVSESIHLLPANELALFLKVLSHCYKMFLAASKLTHGTAIRTWKWSL